MEIFEMGEGRAIRTRYPSLERTVKEGFENLANEIRCLKVGKDPSSRRGEEEEITVRRKGIPRHGNRWGDRVIFRPRRRR